jgi:molecular chaperone DnaK
MKMNDGLIAGTDLGTTNSAAAVLRGNAPLVIKNNLQEEYTPSAVRETRVSGQVVKYVGRKAKDALAIHPDDVAVEFKLKMGMPEWRFRFAESGRDASAVELSAELLRELANSIKRQLGEEVSAMLVTVPAAFTNPKYEATKQAGELAGIGQVQLLEEPVAAAWAFSFDAPDIPKKGHWLVYDLGGGTFDTALVRLEDGVFTVFDHDGDQYLGGKGIDAAIVERYLLPKLPEELRAQAIPWKSATWWKLKFAAETAKIELSAADIGVAQAEFPNLDFKYVLKQDDLTPVQEPTITKSIEICRRLLAKHGLAPNQVDRLILVGGPTLSRYVRRRVKDELGIRIDFTVDPLTAVARGAAICAKSRSWAPPRPRDLPDVKVNLNYLAMTVDTEPLVTGRLEDAKGTKSWSGWNAELSHLDAAGTTDWTSGKVATNPEGAFSVTARCVAPDSNRGERLRENRFRLAVTDPTGREASTDAGSFTITVGMESGGIQLPRGIGVVKQDGTVLWFFDAGRPLSCERTIPLKTTKSLAKGSKSEEALEIPVVEEGIDRTRGKYNWLIGTLRVRADRVFTDIPEGSPVDVTVAVDESRTITVSAYFPNHEIESDPMVIQAIAMEKLEDLRAELNAIKKVTQVLAPLRQEDDDVRRILDEIDSSGLIQEIEKLLPQVSKENPDAGQKAREHIMRLQKLLDAIADRAQSLHKWNQQKDEYIRNVEACRTMLSVLDGMGKVTADQKMRFAALEKEFKDACRRRDTEEARKLAMEDIPGLDVFENIPKNAWEQSTGPIITFPGQDPPSTVRD